MLQLQEAMEISEDTQQCMQEVIIGQLKLILQEILYGLVFMEDLLLMHLLGFLRIQTMI